MQKTQCIKDIQNFIYSVQYEGIANIDSIDPINQSQILDYFIQLLDCFNSLYRGEIVELHFHPEFFILPTTEEFFSQLFTSLDLSLTPNVDKLFQRCCVFIADFIGPSETIPVMQRILEKLKIRFPHLNETYNIAISTATKEFFWPTIGDFIDLHTRGINYLQTTSPILYSLFIIPLSTTPLRNCKLFNFYCNPWIYHRIINFLAYYERQDISLELIEKPLEWLEECLQTIRNQTNDDSWGELTQKAHKLCNASNNLEAFATQSSGLLGEIKTAAQFIRNQMSSNDELVFLPEKQSVGKNCDLMVIRYETADCELIESKAKSPRHGLDASIAGDLQMWDDFFDNFTYVISSYLYYLQDVTNPIFGLKIAKCFPLFSAFEGSSYGVALPLIENMLLHSTITANSISKLSSEQKLAFLLQTLFLRPLVLDTSCVPLRPESERLIQRQQATKEALQKNWVNELLKKATEQLEETYQRQIGEGQKISKMHVALDLALSYRLLQDPFSYHDGDIKEIAEQILQKAFKPFKKTFDDKGIDLYLLVINS